MAKNISQIVFRILLMTLALQVVSCGGKGKSVAGDDDGTVNPPAPSGEMRLESGVFFSGVQSESDEHALTAYFTPYQTTTMESQNYTALDLTIQTVYEEN